jgi:hypothetical protein
VKSKFYWEWEVGKLIESLPGMMKLLSRFAFVKALSAERSGVNKRSIDVLKIPAHNQARCRLLTFLTIASANAGTNNPMTITVNILFSFLLTKRKTPF